MLRQGIERFAHGGDLSPDVEWELLQYALGLSVSRRVEGVHAQIRIWQRKKIRMSPCLLNESLNKTAVLKLFDSDPDFHAFVCKHLQRSRLAWQALMHTVPPNERWRYKIFGKERARWADIYMFSPESQHRAIGGQTAVHRHWVASTASTLEPSTTPPSSSPTFPLMMSFLKSRLEVPGVVFSLPLQIFNDCVFEASDPSPVLEALPDPAMQLDCLVEVQREPVGHDDAADHQHFQVVNARPEDQKFMKVAHKSSVRCTIVVTRLRRTGDNTFRFDDG
eukprot:8815459-Pyramimonas_sp.AAC.1